MEQLWEDQKISGGQETGAALTRFSGRNKAVRAVYTDVEGNHPYVSQDGEKIRGYRLREASGVMVKVPSDTIA